MAIFSFFFLNWQLDEVVGLSLGTCCRKKNVTLSNLQHSAQQNATL